LSATNPQGKLRTPRQENEADAERRREAQARRPLIAKWAPNIPTGYIHIDDAIEYMTRRWGRMLRAETLEAFSREETGPKYAIVGDWPNKNRSERYYKFDDIDMWVYRTVSGVPAGWNDVRKLPKGRRSTVPIRRIELTDMRELLDGKEPSNGWTGIEEDGRRRN
jgi:hypothetical protein